MLWDKLEGTSATEEPGPRSDRGEGGPAPALDRRAVILFAVACGLSVANISFADPLLATIADDLRMDRATVGLVVTVTQAGYALGLLLLVPLGDVLDRRRLIVSHAVLTAAALLVVSLARTGAMLLIGVGAVGLLAVVTQLVVAHAALLAPPSERGRVVGLVTSGVITGILLARSIAGGLGDLFGWRSVYVASGTATLLVALLLFLWAPPQASRGEPVPYPLLVASVVTLFAEEPVLRIRATIAFLAFCANAVLWTSMSLPLGDDPLGLTTGQIGLFGLAGVTGALGAAAAGRLADRGFAQRTTVFGLSAMLLSWMPASLLQASLVGLAAGIALIAFGLQSVHVSSQSLVLARRPEAQSRLVAAYMVCYSAGSAAGAILSTLTYARLGWSGVCGLGATVSALALLFWGATRDRAPSIGSTRPPRRRVS